MGALGLATALGISTALTTAQFPFSLRIGGNELIASVDATSYSLDDMGGGPAKFSFRVADPTKTLSASLVMQARVIWYSSAQDLNLFQGFVKDIRPAPSTTWLTWQIDCSDISELLDFTPVIAEIRPAESDQSRIGFFLGSVPGLIVGSIGSLASLPATTVSQQTARSAVVGALAPSTQADYFVDAYGQFSTYAGVGGPAAPYAIDNDAPNGSTTIAAAAITPEQDGYSDVDAVYVFGATQAGTGLVQGTNVPRGEKRVAVMSSDTSVDAGSLAAVGAAELYRRQNLLRVSVTVDGKDGWKRGQVITITDSRIGYSGRTFVIQGVSMHVQSVAGSAYNYAFRRYVLTCGAYQASIARLVGTQQTPLHLVGPIGGM